VLVPSLLETERNIGRILESRPKRLIEPLVGGIERGDGDVDDFHLADGAVEAARLDENGGHEFDGVEFAVEFHESFAFQDEMNLGQLFVLVSRGVGLDVDEMNRSDGVVGRDKGTTRLAAGTGDGIDVGQMGDGEVGHELRHLDEKFVETARAITGRI
jgi:hypothetical protein